MQQPTRSELWSYREPTWSQTALTDFKVEADDGSIGKIDEASREVGAGYLVVDTGPWIFGKKVMLPAGVVREIDVDSQTVFVDLTKDEIKDSPEFDEDRYTSDAYRAELGGYYGDEGRL